MLCTKGWAHGGHFKNGASQRNIGLGCPPGSAGSPSLQESEQRDTAKCKFDNQTPCWGSWTAEPALILGCLGRCSLAARGLVSILGSAAPSFVEDRFSGPG